MINENEKKCINPWFGFLAIVLTCIILASAIAFGYRDSGRKKRRPKAAANNAAIRVGLGSAVTDVYTPTNQRFLF
jgi:hypothetical protein